MNKPEEGLYDGHFINFKDIVLTGLNKRTTNVLIMLHYHIKRIFDDISVNTNDRYFDNYIFTLCNECMFLISDYLTHYTEIQWTIFYKSLLNILNKITDNYASTESDGCISRQEGLYICNLLLYSLDMDFLFYKDELTEDDYKAYFEGYGVLYRYDNKLGDYVENVLRTKIINGDKTAAEKILHYILDAKYSLNITKHILNL